MAGPSCVCAPVRGPLWEMELGRWVQPQLGGRALERRSSLDVILKLVSFPCSQFFQNVPLGESPTCGRSHPPLWLRFLPLPVSALEAGGSGPVCPLGLPTPSARPASGPPSLPHTLVARCLWGPWAESPRNHCGSAQAWLRALPGGFWSPEEQALPAVWCSGVAPLSQPKPVFRKFPAAPFTKSRCWFPVGLGDFCGGSKENPSIRSESKTHTTVTRSESPGACRVGLCCGQPRGGSPVSSRP